MRLSDRLTGGFLVALGAASAYAGSKLPPVPGQQVGPNVFPAVVGTGLVLCGVLIAVGIGRGFEEHRAADPLAAGDAVAHDGAGPSWRVLIPPALLFLYVTLVERLGFVPTAAMLVFITAVVLGARLRLAVPLALLAPIGAHLVFAKLLRVALPPGLLPMPW